MLFGHHTKTYLGLDIDINGHPFPDGPFDHLVFLACIALAAYGIFALIRDGLRWRRRRIARSS